MPPLSDEKIMLLVKEGHLSELTELFERYHVKLYNFFLRLTQERSTSQDLTQNLFYRVIKYRESYKPENGSFRSWIYRMARNVYADFCRQAQRVPDRPLGRADIGDTDAAGGQGNYGMTGGAVTGGAVTGGGVPDSGGIGGGTGSGEERWSEEHYARLDQALAGLQPEQREIIVLSRFQGLKYEEIARIKEISVSAIKVQVHRAIKKLRHLYFSTSS